MTVEIYADVAKFQPLLDSTYPRKFVMFRLVNEYGNIDSHAAANIATAIAMRRSGKLVNFGGYVNPGHIANSTMLAKIRELGFPTDAQIMLDVESWPNDKGVPLISGDHSVSLSVLTNAVRTRQQGRSDLIVAYGNRHDLAALYPRRPSWLGLVIAGYNTNDPRGEYPNLFAWQYTNGTENHTAWPSASSPFGHCDHNAMFAPIPDPVVGTNYDILEDDVQADERAALMRIDAFVTSIPVAMGQLDRGGTIGKVLPAVQALHNDINNVLGQTGALKTAVLAAIAAQQTTLEADISTIVAGGGDPAAIAGAVIDLIRDRLAS
jgi:hypothetical protein